MKLAWQNSPNAAPLVETLVDALQNHQRVIWLVPGGSNIAISVAASRQLDSQLTKRLVVMQTDERFVAPNSPDCNWHQLIEAGLEIKQAVVFPVITTENASLDETVAAYNQIVAHEFAAADAIIGQFGVGPDGHVAGIKPDSPAAESAELVAGFKGDDFTRITLTFPAIRQLSTARTFAYGPDKRWVFERLGTKPTSASSDFPAGVLNEIDDSIIYNDQLRTPEAI